MKKDIYYWKNPGKENTDNVIELVKERVNDLGIENLVVASVTGESSLKVAQAIDGVKIASLTHHAGFKEGDELELVSEYKDKLKEMGIDVYIASHALSGVGRGITNQFGGITPVEIIAATLRMFSQGVKVCVEISIMAADAGLIPTDKEVIAMGGTAKGLDTAIVLKPAHMSNFFDLRIKEIIAMPRP